MRDLYYLTDPRSYASGYISGCSIVVSQQRSTWHHHGSHEFAAPLQPDRRKNDSHALTHWLVASPGTCKSS